MGACVQVNEMPQVSEIMGTAGERDPLGEERACGAAIMFGGIAGGLGVAFAAMAAHIPGAELLSTASLMLLVHAPAFLALAALNGVGPRFLLPFCVLSLALGVLLFSGDLALRVFSGGKMFDMAAPMGGGLMIIGWTGVIVLGVARILRRS